MNRDDVLEIERTPEFFETAKKLSEFVDKLDLSTKKNNELVRLMVAQTEAAERSGFAHGVRVGIKAKELYEAMSKGYGGILSLTCISV